MLEKQLGLSPSGKDRSKGCLWLMGIPALLLVLLLGVYGIQMVVVAHRYSKPAQTQILSHGFTIEAWEQRSLVDAIPILGFFHLNHGGECILIIKKDGVECKREYFYQLNPDGFFDEASLYQTQGKVVVQVQGGYNWYFILDFPAPSDLLPLPEPATPPKSP